MKITFLDVSAHPETTPGLTAQFFYFLAGKLRATLMAGQGLTAVIANAMNARFKRGAVASLSGPLNQAKHTMKSKPNWSFVVCHFGFALFLSSLILFGLAPRAPAQSNVTVSAADFQRVVYSAELEAELALKPEVQASLQVLLDMQRRNPNGDPAGLASVLTNALQIYRTSAPGYIRTNGYPDEVLAAYLECLRQVPARTNFVSADLTLLSHFMLGPADYDPKATPFTTLLNSGYQRLFASANEPLQRQALVNDCMARARGNAAFATAMEALLRPETGVWLDESPVGIITYSPLHNSPTFTNLLAMSEASGDGSLTISTNQVWNLDANDMQTAWQVAKTNLTVRLQINQNLPDVLSYLTYLTNQAAMAANEQYAAAVQQGQPAQLACATAAVLVQSALLSGPEYTSDDQTVEETENTAAGAINLAKGMATCLGGDPSGTSDMLSGEVGLFNQWGPSTPTLAQIASEQMATQLTNIQTMLGDLGTNMNYRFDRVDQSLTTMFSTMNKQFNAIEIEQNGLGQQVASLNVEVDDIRNSLVSVQSSLDQIEQDVTLDFQTDERDQYLIAPANSALFFATQNPGTTMTYTEYGISPGYEADFYNYATTLAGQTIFSPSLTWPLAQQLASTNSLAAGLNCIQQYLDDNLNQPTLGSPPLANPQEWFMGAYAYLQLAMENPLLFREKGLRVPAIIAAGKNLTNFLTTLTFNGTNVNWNLWYALEANYFNALTNFNAQASAFETTTAGDTNFDIGAWRQWDVTAPAVTATTTEVVSAPANMTLPPAGPWVAISAGYGFSLALKADSTVVGCGDNTYGEATGVPGASTPGTVALSGQPLTNVVAISAGDDFSLALRADSTVVGWGNNTAGQATGVPTTASAAPQQVTIPGLTNVVAIAAGLDFSLALKADGTVVGWGDNAFGQATGVPNPVGTGLSFGSGTVFLSGQVLTHAVAISAGDVYSLFLTAANPGAAPRSGVLTFLPAQIPSRVLTLFQYCNEGTITELGLTGSDLDEAAAQLVGAKLLLTDVLELGMPYTMERDGVLHGLLYGSSSLMDPSGATNFLQAQNAQIQTSPATRCPSLSGIAALTYLGFQQRLNQDLTNLQAAGQPEIPRLVGQTLRLLDLLQDAWTSPTNSPPPALELCGTGNSHGMLLYGEPYVNYTLQSCDSLSAGSWTNTATTTWEDGQTNALSFSGSRQRFYRAALPMP